LRTCADPFNLGLEMSERAAYYDRIRGLHLAPLWEVLGALVPAFPNSPAAVTHWRYAALRAAVLEAGRVLTAEEAERRVLILENPAMPGQACITPSLYAGLQLIMPGEIAPAHRHTQSALRLVIEGEGAYTTVDGERIPMHRGDCLITPAWTWHDHGNVGADPVVWLDGLDIPTVRFFDAGFAEKSPHAIQEARREEGDALARYGSNLMPVDYHPRPSEPTRQVVYSHRKTREALHAIAKGAVDPHFGHKLRYVNPATGASPMPTIGAFAQLLPEGFEGRSHRSTDGTIYVCLDGACEAILDDKTIELAPNDVLVVPSWHALRLRTTTGAELFSFSDRPVHQALGFWREERT
jgi:gentisate 1,2-dioxygenase